MSTTPRRPLTTRPALCAAATQHRPRCGIGAEPGAMKAAAALEGASMCPPAMAGRQAAVSHRHLLAGAPRAHQAPRARRGGSRPRHRPAFSRLPSSNAWAFLHRTKIVDCRIDSSRWPQKRRTDRRIARRRRGTYESGHTTQPTPVLPEANYSRVST